MIISPSNRRDRRGRDRMDVGFTPTYAISAHHHQSCEFKSRSWRGILDTTLCDKLCQWLTAGRWFSPGTPVSSTNKADSHDVAEIFLKVALNTITLALKKTACWCYYRNVYYINVCANNAWSINVLLIVDYYYPDEEMNTISRMREIKLPKQRAIEKKIIHCILFKFLDCILFVDIHNCLIGIQLNIVKKTYIRMHINNIISRLWRVIKGWT